MIPVSVGIDPVVRHIEPGTIVEVTVEGSLGETVLTGALTERNVKMEGSGPYATVSRDVYIGWMYLPLQDVVVTDLAIIMQPEPDKTSIVVLRRGDMIRCAQRFQDGWRIAGVDLDLGPKTWEQITHNGTWTSQVVYDWTPEPEERTA